MSRMMANALVCCLAALAVPVSIAAAQSSADAAWNEKKTPLSKWRWQLDDSQLQQHLSTRPASSVVSDIRIRWTEDAKKLDGLTDEERWNLSKLKVDTLSEGLPADALRGMRVTVDVLEAWRPYRALNVVLFALPGPGPAMVTQGGVHAVLEFRHVDTDRVMLRMDCREYAGFLAFAGAFARVSHVRTAMQTCVNNAVALFKTGQLAPMMTAGSAASQPELKARVDAQNADRSGGDAD